MKTSNNNNKVTKDTLLHKIFQEIADENIENSQSTPSNDLIPTPEKTSSKRVVFLKWILLLAVLQAVPRLRMPALRSRTWIAGA